MASCKGFPKPIGARAHRGFSYIGLLIFIAITGVVAAGTVSTGAILHRRAQEEDLFHIGRQFQAAFKSYYESTPVGQRPYPASLNDLVKDPRFPVTRRHLRRVYADPLTGQADWGTVAAPGGGISGVFSRSEGKPIKVAGFSPEFASFEGQEKYSQWVFGHTPLVVQKPGVAPVRF